MKNDHTRENGLLCTVPKGFFNTYQHTETAINRFYKQYHQTLRDDSSYLTSADIRVILGACSYFSLIEMC